MASDSEMESLRRELRDLIEALGGFRGEVSNTTRNTRELGEEARDSADEISAEADYRRAQREAEKKENEAKRSRAYALDQAYRDSENAVKSLTKSFISGEVGFAKYNSGISSAGDAAFNFGKSLGPLGAILGGVVKGATMVAEAAFKQADNLLKASDQISKLGAANAFSTEQIRQMGAGAGLASDQLDKMLKPLGGMSRGMAILGATQAESVKRFSEMAAVTKKTREEFQRLGLNDEDRIQAQADFVDMMAKTGSSLQGNLRTQKGLQDASLAYTKNLYELSNITGKNIEESKKDIELSRATYEWGLAQYKYQRDIKAATEKGTPEGAREAERLQKELNAFQTMLAEAQARGGQKEAAALAQRIVSKGAGTAETAFYDQRGQDINKLLRAVRAGEEYKKGVYTDQSREATSRFVDNVGIQALALNKEFGESVVSFENLTETTVNMGKSAVASAEAATTALTDNQKGKGPAAEDPAQIARNALTEAERSAKLALDDLLASINPLVNGFNTLSAGLMALTAAAGAAAIGLGAKSAASGASSLLGRAAPGLAAGGIGSTLMAAAVPAAVAAGVTYAGVKGVEYLANRELDKDIAEKDEQTQQRANDEYNAALKDTGWSYDLSKGGLLDPTGKHVSTAEAPEDVRAIATEVYEKRRVKVTAKDKGGPVKPGELALVGEFGPELLAGPGMVTSRKDTEAILMEAMQGVGNKNFSTATMRTQQLVAERKVRDLVEEKETELDNLSSLNMTLGILNDSAIELSEVFYEVEEQLRSIFGTEEIDVSEPADPTSFLNTLENGIKDLFGVKGEGGTEAPPVVPSDMSNLENPEKIKAAMAYFMKQGWSHEQSAGILGNLMAESGRDLKTNAVGDRGKAFGIAQWHPDRQAKFKEVFGKDIRQSTLEEQLAFVNWELKNTEAKAGGMLSKARSGEQAAATVDKFYERSSGEHRGRRMSNAAGLIREFSETEIAQYAAPETKVASANTSAEAKADAMKSEAKSETPAEAPTKPTPTFTTVDTSPTDMLRVNAQLLDNLGSKLDTMIAKLDESNTIQEKIMRQTA